MRYSYKALDINGNEVSGEIDAEKKEEVGTWLSDRNYIVVDIVPAPIQTLVNTHKRRLRILSIEFVVLECLVHSYLCFFNLFQDLIVII